MNCRTCKTNSSRIKVVDGIDNCINCGLQETGGAKSDGLITRNSFRIREQQKQYESDMTPAFVYDKHSKKVTANKDYIQRFPDQASRTFTSKEMNDVGITKLKGKK